MPGPVIGEALAEIDAHCADSGPSPAEAFGDPVDYAVVLARDLRPTLSGPRRAGLGGLKAAGDPGRHHVPVT